MRISAFQLYCKWWSKPAREMLYYLRYFHSEVPRVHSPTLKPRKKRTPLGKEIIKQRTWKMKIWGKTRKIKRSAGERENHGKRI